jgi:hypothetical protein
MLSEPHFVLGAILGLFGARGSWAVVSLNYGQPPT